jgi:hypothetical protein
MILAHVLQRGSALLRGSLSRLPIRNEKLLASKFKIVFVSQEVSMHGVVPDRLKPPTRNYAVPLATSVEAP